MFKTLVFSTLLVFSFTSCSSKDALTFFSKGEKENRAVLNTKKADIFKNKKIKMMLWATYLNETNKKQVYKNESFIISTYFIDDNSHDFLAKNYEISLNEKKPLSVNKIQLKDSIYESFINHNPWASYYLIEFKKDEKIYDLNLEIKKADEKTSITFVK